MEEKQDMLDNESGDGNAFLLSDLLLFIKQNWYWFAASVVLCCGVAGIYLLRAPKVYTRTASVLIKDNSKGGSISESAAFDDLQIFNVVRNVDNELLVFKSKQLMSNVVKRLHLDISYTVKEGLRTKELYIRSPLIVQFPEVEDRQTFSLTVTPLSGKKALISGFPGNPGEEITVQLNDTVMTPIGKIIVTPSLYYTDDCFDRPITLTKYDMGRITPVYSNALQVALANKTSTIINLTLNDASTARAEDVLNTLIAVYNENAINDKNQIMMNTSAFINERLIVIEKELGNVDTDIETFKRENRLTDIHSETTMYLQESSQYTQDELSLVSQRSLAVYIRNYLTDLSKTASLIPSNTGISDANIVTQINEYNAALLKRDQLIRNSSDRNPVVMELNHSLSALKQTIIRAIDNLIEGLNIKIRNTRSRDRQTAARIAEVPAQQKQVLSIERQQKIKEALYLYLLNKREENALSQTISESNARIIDAAAGSNLPVAPKKSTVMLSALLLGLGIPGGIFWTRSMLNTKVLKRKEIEDAVTLPFLGEIPLRDRNSHDELVVLENSSEPIAEAFRMIRTRIEFMRPKVDPLQVILFTSLNPKEGKTFVSKNLALSITLTKKKVIRLDLDIRKAPPASEPPKTGIANYLSGETNEIGSLIRRIRITGQQTLDIISSGSAPLNPAELLLSDRLDRLINVLRKHYDYVIVDNHSYGTVADVDIVSRMADLTLFVVRAGVLDKRQLPELEKIYKQEKFRNMGIILNGATE
ncbi:MAG: polysaccharide biosynthesis tyrosine autokinase [Tannerella sp.]|jgi:capsular exopolysaccharide synthesis family protein|nr:polysaccharide biosynthesis tyrosine autokinase [Tannerella sp.]